MTADRFEDGVRLFDRGEFWEAHEAWEDVWAPLDDGPEKTFYQALIQFAAALDHATRTGRLTGGAFLLDEVERKLSGEMPEETHGVDIARLLERVRGLREAFAAGGGIPEELVRAPLRG